MFRRSLILGPVLAMAGALLTSACASLHLAPADPGPKAASASSERKKHCDGGHCCGDYCDNDNNPCDPKSGCTCALLTNTCEPRSTWCTGDAQCQGYLEDRGARCIAHACWGTGTNCQSQSCKNGDGCASDQDCEAGWTCSTGNGVCQAPLPPPDSCQEPGWTWDPRFAGGGCVPPASWPVSTSCQPAADSPPTCLRCPQNPWESGQNCPQWNGQTTYLFLDDEQFYCCVECPDEC